MAEAMDPGRSEWKLGAGRAWISVPHVMTHTFLSRRASWLDGDSLESSPGCSEEDSVGVLYR